MKLPKFSEPWAVYSNVFYFFVAFAVAFAQPGNIILIAALLFLGVASCTFHMDDAKTETPAHRADEGAIYAVLLILLFQAWGSLSWMLFPVFLLLPLLVMNLASVDLFKITPALSVAVIIGIWYMNGFESAGAVIVAGLAAGFVRLRIPDSDIQHAVWHFLSAASLYLAWLGTL